MCRLKCGTVAMVGYEVGFVGCLDGVFSEVQSTGLKEYIVTEKLSVPGNSVRSAELDVPGG